MTPEERQSLEQRRALLTRKKELLAQKAQAAPAPEPAAEEAGFFESVGNEALTLAGSAASGFNQGVKDIAGLPLMAGNLIGKALSAVGAENITPDWAKGEGLNLDKVPLVQDFGNRVVPEGENALADALRTGSEWGAGGISNLAKNVLTRGPTLAKTGGDALMGVMAAGGEAIGGDTGEMIGGLFGLKKMLQGDTLGSTASSIAEKVADRVPFIGAESKAARANERASDSAVKFISQNVADMPAAKANLTDSVEEGLAGTLTDATGDLGVAAVEMMGRDTPTSQLAITDALRQREKQVVDTIAEPFGDVATTGDAARVGAQETIAGTQGRIDNARTRAEAAVTDTTEAGLTRARAAADEAEAAAQTAETTEQGLTKALGKVDPTTTTSTTASQTLDDAAATFKRDIEDPAWAEFRDGSPMDAKELQAGVKAELAKLTAEEKRGLKRAYPTVFSDVNAWKGDVSPSSVQYVRNSITDALNKVEKGGFGQLEKRMIGMRDRIDDVIESGDRADAWRKGKAATARKNEMYNAGDIGKQRNKADQQAFLEKLPYAGDQGKVTAQNLKASEEPAVIQAAQDWFKGRNKNKTIDQKFIDANEGFLSEFPALKTEYQAIADAGATTKEGRALAKAVSAEQGKRQTGLMSDQKSGLKQTRARAEQRKGQTDETVLGRYAKNPSKTIKDTLANADNTGDITTLANRMERSGQTPSFKADVRKVITDTVSDMNTGDIKMKGNAVTELEKMRKPLIDSGLVTAKDFDKMTRLAIRNARGKTIRQRMSNLQSPSSSGEATNLEASAIAAAIGSVVPTGSQLMVAGALRRAVKKQLSRVEVNDKTLQKIDEYVVDPEAFMRAMDKRDVAALNKAKDAEEYARLLMPKLVATGQTLADDNE